MPAAGTATGAVNWRVASTTERNALVVRMEEVGKLCHVLSGSGTLYMAIQPGTGSGIWQDFAQASDVTSAAASAEAAARIQSYARTIAFDDVDVDVAATSAEVDIGDPLPAGAFVLGVYANVTEDFDDGAAGTFSADVGDSGGDDDRYTPTALDIDGGVAELGSQLSMLPAGGEQITVTLTGSANLSTLTSGSVDIVVTYFVPTETVG